MWQVSAQGMRIERWGGPEGRETRTSSRERQEGGIPAPQFIVATAGTDLTVFDCSQPEYWAYWVFGKR